MIGLFQIIRDEHNAQELGMVAISAEIFPMEMKEEEEPSGSY